MLRELYPAALRAYPDPAHPLALAVLDALRVIDISNNLGDAKSLITHPATTTHQRLPPEERAGSAGEVVREGSGDEDALALTNRLAELGAEALSEAVCRLQDGTATRTPQDHSAFTYAPMLDRSLSPLDFTKPARQLHDQVRGLIPWPCAVMTLDGKMVKVYRTAVGGDTAAAPGKILAAGKNGIDIACGDGKTLRILEVQAEGGKRMTAANYLCGHPVQVDA